MRLHEFATRSLEDRHPNDKPFGPESRPRMPAGTVRVDVSDVYDWYKLGQHVSNLKGLGRHDFGQGPPSTIFSFGDENTEHKYIKDLERTGLKTTDIDPAAHGKKTGQKTDPTYDVDENVSSDSKFVKPNFDFEWEEAERYPEFARLGKDDWIELARKGRAVTIKSARGINNTDAADPDSFKSLHPAKQKRALAQLETGTVEMPIVAVYSDGHKELVGGNTRLTAMMARDGQATVWAFRVPGQQGVAENFADGKKPGRKGLAKRVGVNCKQPVSKLRSIASNSSGERQRMAHWCANMKSGKKK